MQNDKKMRAVYARTYNVNRTLIYAWSQLTHVYKRKRRTLYIVNQRSKIIKEQKHFHVKVSFVQISKQLNIVAYAVENDVNNGDGRIRYFIFLKTAWTIEYAFSYPRQRPIKKI